MDLLAPNKNMNAMTEMNDIDCTSIQPHRQRQLKIGLLTLFFYVYRDEMLRCQISLLQRHKLNYTRCKCASPSLAPANVRWVGPWWAPM